MKLAHLAKLAIPIIAALALLTTGWRQSGWAARPQAANDD